MRRVLSWFAVASWMLATGCPCSTVLPGDIAEAGTLDAGPGDAAPVEVNCADPSVWAAAPELEGYFQVGGGACAPPQYPLHAVYIGPGLTPEARMEVRSSCWRVEEAHEDSGWEVGQTFGVSSPGASALVQGFERPVTFSGRLFRADGTLAYAVSPLNVALDATNFIDMGTEEVVALMRPDAWATRFAVHAFDQVVATEEVIAGSGGWNSPNTLHRRGDGFLARFWRVEDGLLTSTDISLGEGERALLADGGGAVAVDESLILLGADSISRRVSLSEAPLSLVSQASYIVVQFRDSLRVVFRDEEHEGFEIPVTPDPTARLVEAHGGNVAYYTGGAFAYIDLGAAGLRSRVR